MLDLYGSPELSSYTNNPKPRDCPTCGKQFVYSAACRKSGLTSVFASALSIRLDSERMLPMVRKITFAVGLVWCYWPRGTRRPFQSLLWTLIRERSVRLWRRTSHCFVPSQMSQWERRGGERSRLRS